MRIQVIGVGRAACKHMAADMWTAMAQQGLDSTIERAGDLVKFVGLAITKSIVEPPGGTITAASTLGAGSAFMVTLPVTRK